MSGKPPESGKPLTFQPSVDDKEQLNAFLKGVYQQYLAGRSPTQQGASNAETQNTPQKNSKIPPDASATHHVAASAASSRVLHSRESFEQGASTPKPTGKLPAANNECLEDHLRSGKRKRAPRSPASKQRDGKVSDPSSSSGSLSVAGSSTTDKRVNHALIEKQLNVIARASLLRANTINVNAPDPEQDAPANETQVQKRRRLERINGRRKRARKLIEMDSLNERLVSLVDRNKKLKVENEDIRQKIDGIRKVNSEDGDLTKILEIISAGSTAAAVESAAAQIQGRASRAQVPSVAPSILQHNAQLSLQQPQVQALLPQQQQTSSLLFGITGQQQQQQQLFALLGNNQLSSLATSQSPAQLGSHPLLQLSGQPLQFQQQQQQQQLAALLPMFSAASGLYAGIPSNLQAPTVSSPASLSLQHPRTQWQAPAAAAPAAAPAAANVRVNSTALAEEKMASPARRAGTPPPKTAKELKAWIKRHRDEKK